MKKVCAWCKADLGEMPSEIHPAEAITHGICISCRDRLLSEGGQTLRDFLEKLNVPILLMDQQGCVLSINGPAQLLLGKKLHDIENRLAGEVIECVHSREPGGCGGTIHCKSCTIRKTVADTYASGNSHVGVPAYQDIGTLSESRQVRFLITTEKIGSRVMLRIDDVQENRSTA
jgi:PAS domain-containing protein